MFVKNEEGSKVVRLKYLDNTARRQSLYESPAQTAPKSKRSDPVHAVSSAGPLETTQRKLSPPNTRRLSREGENNLTEYLPTEFLFSTSHRSESSCGNHQCSFSTIKSTHHSFLSFFRTLFLC